MAAARVRTDQVEITLLSCVISNTTVGLQCLHSAHLKTNALHTVASLLLYREFQPILGENYLKSAVDNNAAN